MVNFITGRVTYLMKFVIRKFIILYPFFIEYAYPAKICLARDNTWFRLENSVNTLVIRFYIVPSQKFRT